ncbi:MAG: ATP-dependent sacrificial sulfur transferase LarE [Calditrichia bacterium]
MKKITSYELQSKFTLLKEKLSRLPNLVVAYSGGVDSTFLLATASEVLGERVMGVIGVSSSLPSAELQEALQFARQFGWQVTQIPTNEMQDENYLKNDDQRCYYCKKELFSEAFHYARQNGFSVIADGTNADDSTDYRPGSRAAAELSVIRPLKDCGLSKAEIRQLSRDMGLPSWNKAELACLSSRIPIGNRVTAPALRRVEQAENFLKQKGFHILRVRHHDKLARIEVSPQEIDRLLQQDMREQVDQFFRSLGYLYVTVDLRGYRRGSLNAERPALAEMKTPDHGK